MGAPNSAMMPSPVYWLTVPSKRCTPSVRMAKKRSRIVCHASGSSCSASSIDPFTSANNTVTCLRSPSNADFDCRIFSARCLGVYERGERLLAVGLLAVRGADVGPPPSSAPHSPQNFSAGACGVPQALQLSVSLAPHSTQNLRPVAFSTPHDGHLMMPVHLPPNGQAPVALPSLREQRVDLPHPHRRTQPGEERLGFFEEALARPGVAFEARPPRGGGEGERGPARRAGLVDEPVGLAQRVADGGRCRSVRLDEEHMRQRP